MQIFMNAPSTHMHIPHSSLGLHSESSTSHPAISTSENVIF